IGLALLASTLQWLGKGGLGDVMNAVGLDPASEVGVLIQERSLDSPMPANQIVGNHTNTGFGGLLVFDYFTVYVRLFLYSFTLLVVWLTMLTGVPDREDSADFYTLLLGATLGM